MAEGEAVAVITTAAAVTAASINNIININTINLPLPRARPKHPVLRHRLRCKQLLLLLLLLLLCRHLLFMQPPLPLLLHYHRSLSSPPHYQPGTLPSGPHRLRLP